MNGQRCRLVDSVLVPHKMMNLEWAQFLGQQSGPAPMVTAEPELPALPQTARTSCVAPSRAKNASLTASPCTRPWVPR